MKIALNISDIEPGHYEDATALLVEVNKTIAKFKETRPCSPDSSASPAAASVGSESTDGGESRSSSSRPSTKAGGSPSRTETMTNAPAAGSVVPTTTSSRPASDPTAAIRADPRRPKWLKDEMLPLPVGTVRVRRYKFRRGCDADGCTIGAFPSWKIWWDITLEWAEGSPLSKEDIPTWQDAEVYHVPQPAPADKPTILPPAEMPEALRPYWTPESRVWMSRDRSLVQINPCGKWYGFETKKVHNAYQNPVPGDSAMLAFGYTLLPNRTVTTESILGTASAAKAVEQGVADAVEGRTVEVPAVRLVVDKTDERVVSKPDPLDQLAAEAQAEGEYGTAWDRWVNDHPPVYEWDLNAKSRPHVKDRFNAFIAAECERAVGRAKASPRFGHDPDLDDCDCRSCLREMFEQSKRTIEAMMKSSKNPTPRRTAREVAEGIVDEWFTRGRSSAELILAIVAAIERDQEGR